MLLIPVLNSENLVIFSNEKIIGERENSPSHVQSKKIKRSASFFIKWVMSAHENPLSPVQVTNIYCARYESSVELVAVVGFQEAEFEVSWGKVTE